jgi:hypothetical protein
MDARWIHLHQDRNYVAVIIAMTSFGRARTVGNLLSIRPLQLSGYCMCLAVSIRSRFLRSLHPPTVYPRVPYASHNKQRLFPQTALTGWAL